MCISEAFFGTTVTLVVSLHPGHRRPRLLTSSLSVWSGCPLYPTFRTSALPPRASHVIRLLLAQLLRLTAYVEVPFLMRVQVPGRTCHVIGGAQYKMKMQGPLFKNCAEFQGSHGRALKQEQATSG